MKHYPLLAYLTIFITFGLLSGCVRAHEDETGVGEEDQGGADAVHAELRADVDSITPGESFTLGVQFTIKEPWHIYWKEPGDAGLPTKVRFDLPSGFSAGELIWPPHKEFVQPGDLKGYGYEGEVYLSAPVSTSESITGEQVTLKAEAKWLACSDRCIPGRETVELVLPISRKQ